MQFLINLIFIRAVVYSFSLLELSSWTFLNFWRGLRRNFKMSFELT